MISYAEKILLLSIIGESCLDLPISRSQLFQVHYKVIQAIIEILQEQIKLQRRQDVIHEGRGRNIHHHH